MHISFDTDKGLCEIREGETTQSLPLYSDACFEALSDFWVKIGWNQKYIYTFTWLGRPIIQLPDDMLRMQEVIYALKPDVVVETGVAHGGSLVYYASLFKAMGKGRQVIGVDVEIRPHNRRAIEAHELFPLITLVEGNSVAPEILSEVRSHLAPSDKVLVILDSNHSYQHVFAELEAYGPLVTSGSYIVATDGVMQHVHDVPRGNPAWTRDNPTAAAEDFAKAHPEFVLETPQWPFNESTLSRPITHWPGAWLKRR